MKTCTYDFIKDIVIPSLELLATIAIGIFIAIYLNRKTNKDKIKDLLIDTYIDYLHKFKNFIELETFNLISRYYMKLQSEIDNDKKFNIESKRILLERFNVIIKGLDEKYSPDAFDEKANFSFYTYKFAFLLSKKKYFKLLLPYENKFVNDYLLNTSIKDNEIKELLNNSQIKNDIDQLKNNFSEESFNLLNNHITNLAQQIIDRDQTRFFKKYNDTLAKEIDRY